MGYYASVEVQDDWKEFVQEVNGVPTFVVTKENIHRVTTVPAFTVLPAKWTKGATYMLTMDFIILGEHIKCGYVSDGASVPRPLWGLYPPVGRYLLAAFGHDHILDRSGGWDYANTFFDGALRATGIVTRRRWVIMAGVRSNAFYKTTFRGEPK